MGDDRGLPDQLLALKEALDDTPPEELYHRIVTVVPLLRQEAPEPRLNALHRLSVLRFFEEWNYALEFKCATLAVMALTGFFVGHSEWQILSHESFFSAIVTGDISWEN
jgi:hypothetical protein